MAAAATADLDLTEAGVAVGKTKTQEVTQMTTPPASDEASTSHKDDDAMSSSSLSDLDEEMEDLENTEKFEEAARAGAEAEQFSEVKPDRYEGGVPIFTPNMEQFQDFQRYVKGVNPYGMQSGIVLIDPPEEWKQQRKALDELVKTIKIKNPIMQEFHGAQGVYTQRNMEKQRSYNLPQWKNICESTENQPPAKRGEKRLNADRLLGRGMARSKRSETQPLADGEKRRAGRPRVKPTKEEPLTETDSSLLAPPTPTSPETKAAVPVIKDEDDAEDTAGSTAAKRQGKKTATKATSKARGRPAGSKSGVKKDNAREGKASETTVAARRLRNSREAADEVDEEAFRDFDYRVHDNDQWTAERCDELEDKYWKSLNFSNPMYAADMPGSLFDDETKAWNVAKLPSLLDLIGAPIPGVNTAYLYMGMWRATFAWHLEDVDLYSINYIHFGAPKQWYSISQKDAPKFENAMKSIWSQDAKNCDQFLRHKTYLVAPSLLKSKYGVTVNKVVHREGQFVITFPIGYHSGYNLGYNCAESVNFAIEEWLQYGKTARKCQCEADSVFIDVDWFIRRMNGEPSPEYEEIEVTDDEDDMDDAVDMPTPPGSDRGRVKQKRKRNNKDSGPNKKAKKLIKIRKVSKNQPCVLCPNDYPFDELLPTEQGEQAHRKCAEFIPETYIQAPHGISTVFGVDKIIKDRQELKCGECRQRKGACFQCCSAKCARAYHATCAAQAGVQVDERDVPIWIDDVEYKDRGFDWRCKMHRTVKKGRPSSELASSNHAANAASGTEFKEMLAHLKPQELVQWQVSYVDDIEAGVVVEGYDEGQNTVMVKVLPDMRVVREIDASWILFVDSSTSCLQKPSPYAKDLPEHLKGKTSTLPESERKPALGDPFTEGSKNVWDGFTSSIPPLNRVQKPVDFLKPKQVWLYLGKTSTESKAQYTADPSQPTHDPASHFLGTIETQLSRTIMAPPPQPRRQSLAATFPTVVNVAARNAAMIASRQAMLEKVRQEQDSPRLPIGSAQAQHLIQASRDSFINGQRNTMATPDLYRAQQEAQARANHQRILERDQQRARQAAMQPRPPAHVAPAIGIDQQAVQRQRQFQQQAAQQSRDMSHDWSGGPRTLPPLMKYAPLPDWNSMDASPELTSTPMPSAQPDSGGHSLTFTNNWMSPHPQAASPSYTPQMSPTMSTGRPPSSHSQSPSTMNGHTFSPYTAQSNHSFPTYNNQAPPPTSQDGAFDESMHVRDEISRIDKIRAMANAPSADITQYPRRTSNPAYPFKPPEELKAQKEAQKEAQQNSPPSSSHSQHSFTSPRVKQEQRHPSPFTGHTNLPNGPMDPHNPPLFIDPNVTQITPPNSSRGNQPLSGLDRAYETKVDPLHQPSTMSMSEFVHDNHSLVDSKSGLESSGPRVGKPSQQLLDSLAYRPRLPNGDVVNDRTVPTAWTEWQQQGGFWGDVAEYFVAKHRQAVGAYLSPYSSSAAEQRPGKDGEGGRPGLARRFYEQLTDEQKAAVDQSLL